MVKVSKVDYGLFRASHSESGVLNSYVLEDKI